MRGLLPFDHVGSQRLALPGAPSRRVTGECRVGEGPGQGGGSAGHMYNRRRLRAPVEWDLDWRGRAAKLYGADLSSPSAG